MPLSIAHPSHPAHGLVQPLTSQRLKNHRLLLLTLLNLKWEWADEISTSTRKTQEQDHRHRGRLLVVRA